MFETHFYVYDILFKNKRYIGYGVTEHLKLRDSQHQKTFEESGAVGVLLGTKSFDNRVSASRLEDYLKNVFVDGCVPLLSFRTESLPIEEVDVFLSILRRFDYAKLRGAHKDADRKSTSYGKYKDTFWELIEDKIAQGFSRDYVRKVVDVVDLSYDELRVWVNSSLLPKRTPDELATSEDRRVSKIAGRPKVHKPYYEDLSWEDELFVQAATPDEIPTQTVSVLKSAEITANFEKIKEKSKRRRRESPKETYTDISWF